MSGIQLNFEINANIYNREYNDIPLFSFIRAPFSRAASYNYAIANIDQGLARNMMNLVSKEEWPTVGMKIFSIDEANPLKRCRDNKLGLIYDRELWCVGIKNNEDLNFKSEVASVTMILVNPAFYNLDKQLSYNKIHNDKNSFEILEDYENYLKENVGDVFKFRKIIKEDNKNKEKMEQTLVYAKSDLRVPQFFMNTIKPTNSPSFYFFDDFYMDSDSDSEVTCHLISLTDVNLFKKNENDNNIHIASTKLVREDMLNLGTGHDLYGRTKEKDHVTGVEYYEKDFDAEPQDKKMKKNSSSSDSTEMGKTTVQVPKKSNVTYEKSDKKLSAFYIEDATSNKEFAEERLKTYAKTIDGVKSLTWYEIEKCLPNYIQFGKLYSNSLEDLNTFDSTPVSIVNIFKKTSNKDGDTMDHSAKVLYLRYDVKDNENMPRIE